MLELLNEQEKELLTRAKNKELLWVPLPGPQLDALLSPADELFYGGSAGGGKTDLLLGLAITSHRKSIIFRREFSQFRGAGGLIERSREILENFARYNGIEHLWRDIPGSRMLEFGGVQYEDDKRDYQGRPHDLKAFDEIPEFTESQYRFLIGWARTITPGQRVRVVCTGNPPATTEGEWVIRYWAPWLDPQHRNPAKPGELRWFAMIDGEDTEVDSGELIEHDGDAVRPKSRTFIPARIQDNPYLMDTDYITVLQGLPEPLRSQLLTGDFHAMREIDPWQTIPTAWVQLAQKRWLEREGPDVLLSCVGVDPARGGKDQMAVAKRYGNWFARVATRAGIEIPDGPTGATFVISELGDEEASVNVDVIGIGSSNYDALIANGIDAKPVNFSAKSAMRDKSGRFKMRNVRAAAWWKMRESLDPESGNDVALPPGNHIVADLCTVRYKVTIAGIQIEDKDELKKRLGRSPDVGEALVLANYDYAGGFTFG